MAIRAKCPNPACGKEFNLKTELAGKTVKCDACGQAFKVPPVEGPAPQPAVQSAIGSPQSAIPAKEPPRQAAASEGGVKPPHSKDPLIGKQIAHYRIESLLGKGGMGKVYKARNLNLAKTCAIKVLPPEFSEQDASLIERFIREARSAASVEHPNVLPIQFVGKVGEHYFIEMQYVDGGTLQDLLTRQGRLRVGDAVRVVRDVALALQAAHEKGIVHRDMKPSNVMLTQKGQVFVADFGLAKTGQATTGLTLSGMIVGTPLYMSPEQCQARPLDHRSDIYSLGVMFYQMLAARPPYYADEVVALISQHVMAPIPDVRAVAPDVPAAVSAIIMKMMAKDPAQRYQSCAEVAADLNRVLAALAGGPGALVIGATTAQRAAEFRRSMLSSVQKKRSPVPLVVGLVAVIAIAAGAAAIYLKRQGAQTPTPPTAQQPASVAQTVPAAPTAPAPASSAVAEAAKPSAAVAASAPQPQQAIPPTTQPSPAAAAAKQPETPAAAPAPKPETPVATPAAVPAPKPEAAAAAPEGAKAIEEAAAKTKFDELATELGKLMSARQYDAALAKSREAAKDPAFKGFAAHLGLWQENIQACSRVIAQARAKAKDLVGQKYEVEIKTGARGRMRVSADVLRFEDDTLFLQVGSKEVPYKLDRLGPNEVVRLASQGQGEGSSDRLHQAVLLFAEGSENQALALLREAKERAGRDQAILAAIAATEKFFDDWTAREQRLSDGNRAAELVQKVQADYEAKRWDAVITGVQQLKEKFAQTAAFKKADADLEALLAKAQQEKRLAATEAEKFKFWKFIGPRVPVPGPDGKTEELPAGVISDVRYSPDGKILAVAHAFGVDLWDTQKWAILRRLDGHAKVVSSIDFSPDGSRLVTGSQDRTAVVWDVSKGRPLCKFSSATAGINSVAFSPDGRLVASGSEDKLVSIWRSDNGEEVRAIPGHTAAVRSVAFSPDGAWIASASSDKTVRIWDVGKGKEITCLRGGTDPFHRVAFSPDGKLLASSSYNRVTLIWQTSDWTKKYELKPDLKDDTHYAIVIDFSRDGSLLVLTCISL